MGKNTGICWRSAFLLVYCPEEPALPLHCANLSAGLVLSPRENVSPPFTCIRAVMPSSALNITFQKRVLGL